MCMKTDGSRSLQFKEDTCYFLMNYPENIFALFKIENTSVGHFKINYGCNPSKGTQARTSKQNNKCLGLFALICNSKHSVVFALILIKNFGAGV